MSYHSPAAFRQMTTDVTAQILSALSSYAVKGNLQEPVEHRLRQMSTPLETIAGELLMFGCDAWPETARDEDPCSRSHLPRIGTSESAPSETDPPANRLTPLFWVAASLLVTVPLAMVASHFATPYSTSCVLALGVAISAILFGSSYGLLLAAVSPFAHNLFVIPPTFQFSIPSPTEGFIALGYIVLAAGVGWMVENASRMRRALAL